MKILLTVAPIETIQLENRRTFLTIRRIRNEMNSSTTFEKKTLLITASIPMGKKSKKIFFCSKDKKFVFYQNEFERDHFEFFLKSRFSNWM